MTKDSLIVAVSRKTPWSTYAVKTVIEAFCDVVSESLVAGDKVQIPGFGTFEPKKRAPRTGRNPHTREAVKIPARVVPVFNAGKKLRDAVEFSK